MDAAGVARRTRHTLDRTQNARPTSVHTHFQWSLTTARNIEDTEITETHGGPTGLLVDAARPVLRASPTEFGSVSPW